MLRLHGKPGDYQQPPGWSWAVTQAYMLGWLLGSTALWKRDAGSCEVLTLEDFSGNPRLLGFISFPVIRCLMKAA